MKNKILFIETGGHTIHRRLMKEIGADIIYIPDGEIPFYLPKYSLYIVEGSYIIASLIKRRVKKNAKVITLFCDPRLFYLKINKQFNKEKNRIENCSWLRRIIAEYSFKNLDGAICFGKFLTELLKEKYYMNGIPIRTIYGFIEEERYKQLLKIKPNLSERNIVFIGDGPDYYCKGLDLVIECFREAKKSIPELRLDILGEWKIKNEKGFIKEGIHFQGRVDIVPYLKKASLSLHLGRGEAFGINVAECMLSGIPTIVSEYTGAKEIVPKEFISSLNKKEIIEKIVNYMNLDLGKKKEISKEIRKPSKKFTEKESIRIFKNAIGELENERQNNIPI